MEDGETIDVDGVNYTVMLVEFMSNGGRGLVIYPTKDPENPLHPFSICFYKGCSDYDDMEKAYNSNHNFPSCKLYCDILRKLMSTRYEW